MWAFFLEKFKRNFPKTNEVYSMGLNNVFSQDGKQAVLVKYKQFGQRMGDRIKRDVPDLAKQKQQS